eukprot:6602351-Prorocentrum_lima.AAC.1
MFAWCPDQLVIPSSLTDRSMRTILGNMICVPIVGTVELLVFRAVFAPHGDRCVQWPAGRSK